MTGTCRVHVEEEPVADRVETREETREEEEGLRPSMPTIAENLKGREGKPRNRGDERSESENFDEVYRRISPSMGSEFCKEASTFKACRAGSRGLAV